MRLLYMLVGLLVASTGAAGDSPQPEFLISISVSDFDRTSSREPVVIEYPRVQSFTLRQQDIDGSDSERLRLTFESAGKCHVNIKVHGVAVKSSRPEPWPSSFANGDEFEIDLFWPHHKGELVMGALEATASCRMAPNSALERGRGQ